MAQGENSPPFGSLKMASGKAEEKAADIDRLILTESAGMAGSRSSACIQLMNLALGNGQSLSHGVQSLNGIRRNTPPENPMGS